MDGIHRALYSCRTDFRFLGFSIAMKDNASDSEVRLLTMQNAREMSDAELQDLLRLPVIADGAIYPGNNT